ncbi:RND transporter [Sphingobacterium mizutaii NBRC 14946 = DSM 11724]|uniref:Outer membrane protein oprM n=2 Tax=Sphingobacterium mizutaii TaxID=1010 RepID=A0AAJ5C0V4_9SPHI|nr:TolC family protein [Sphingobacterium mizutaii]GEM67632.1 RND transporter [Sphingobacterium mizutaii NBRC 14946 = DSM 11724]SDL15736.1 efflux transporter, outer membrane factor (OMF) lipoprotein, NodT family [Sphingobacterium mizutaii]SNV52555.1 Outer membrane protein oprM precursor [Sphingobacterium mizutaii]
MENKKYNYFNWVAVGILALSVSSCKVPQATQKKENKVMPTAFVDSLASQDTTNSGNVKWREFFTDSNLISLIDTALKNNQELNITLQELEIAKNDIMLRKGALKPIVGIGAGGGVEKVGRYTSQGAGDASTEITPGHEMPDPLGDINVSVFAHWEVDIWKKLKDSEQAAVNRYLATVEGKNFVLSSLIAEVANSYYELLALDNQLAIIRQNIQLQEKALEVVKIQKEATRVTELAVKKFEAEVAKTKGMEFSTLQQIKETENRINFLLGRYPQEIARNQSNFIDLVPASVRTGIPSQLLNNRPDILQAEHELAAAKLDVQVARKEFYPSLDISAAFGLQAFKPSYLFRLPESLLYNLAGDLTAPLLNKNAIKAEFNSANARQIQAIYNYERTLLNAFTEVSTQLSNIDNLEKGYVYKNQEVDALNKSIDVSNELFKSARADYLEVLMTQRDVLDAKLELIETKKQQLNAVVNVYKALGGGWK